MKTVLAITTLLVVAALVGCVVVPLAPVPPHYGYSYPRAVPYDGCHQYYGPYRHYGYGH